MIDPVARLSGRTALIEVNFCFADLVSNMPLTQDEIDGCRDAFLAYDKDRSGCIEVWELKEVLEGMVIASRAQSGSLTFSNVLFGDPGKCSYGPKTNRGGALPDDIRGR